MRSALHRLALAGAGGIVALAALVAALTWWNERRTAIEREAQGSTGGRIEHAVPLMLANGCAGCHTITGVPGAQGQVGPALDSALSGKVYIAGNLPNTPANMIEWLRFAREIQPRTAMPSTGITEQEARDIAAYLYSLR
jgi:mono/diheme cytochrome c family protein